MRRTSCGCRGCSIAPCTEGRDISYPERVESARATHTRRPVEGRSFVAETLVTRVNEKTGPKPHIDASRRVGPRSCLTSFASPPLSTLPPRVKMSSPPRDIPTSDLEDVEMQQDGAADPSMPNAPPRAPLFLEGTPSVAGTPRHNAVARRAMGLSTPRRPQTPLFAREFSSVVFLWIRIVDLSSKPEPLLHFLSPVRLLLRTRRPLGLVIWTRTSLDLVIQNLSHSHRE